MTPCSGRLEHEKQSSLSDGVKGKLRGLTRMQEALAEARFDLHGKDLLEIGTGWAPVHAVYLSLLGARVTTFDVKRRLKATPMRDERWRRCSTKSPARRS